MDEQDKPQQELIKEIALLKQRITVLEQSESERKQAEEALRVSEEWHRTVLQMAVDGVWKVDLQGRILEVNKSYCRMSGYSGQELQTMRIPDIEAVESAGDTAAHIRKIIELGEDRFETRHRCKGGSIIDLEVSCQYRPSDGGQVVAFLHDVTEHKRTQEELRKREKAAKRQAQENELIAEIGRIISSTLNIEEVYERFAEKVREVIPFDRIAVNTVNTKNNTRTIRYVKGDRFSGDRKGQVLPLAGTWTEHAMRTKTSLLITSKNKEHVMQKFPNMPSLLFGAQTSMIIPLISKDELIGVFAIHSAAVDAYSENDLRLAERVGSQISGAVANVRLFHELKQAEEALRASNELLSLYIHHSPIYTFIKEVTPSRSITLRASENYRQMIGIPGSEMVGKTMEELFPPEFAAKITADDWAVVSNGEVLELDEELNGRSYTTIKFPIVQGGKTLLAGYTIDITERRQAEEERLNLEKRLHRAEKVEALGTLAGGVAHDLNNVLGVLMGYSEMLLEAIPEGNDLRIYINNILKSAERGTAIVEDLLTLARRGVPVSKPIHLNDVISGFLKSPVFEKIRTYHPRVTFRMELDERLLNIKGSPLHLEKTVMNLISNAAEAIAESGEVTIRTESRYLDRALPGDDQPPKGEYAVLSVSDTGGGIGADDLKKIFEPFYTKKKMGRSGTGLGLAIVLGTVKDHDGYIDVQSRPGKGSTFTLYFPVTREEADVDLKMPLQQYRGRGETILVVDDVPQQREMATMMLKSLGYQVQTVSCGEEAADYLKKNSVDLLLLDMIMDPGIDGLETYERIISFKPGQKAVIVSGYSETERVRKMQDLGAGAYVKKPYLKEKIGIAVRQELDRN